MAFKRRFTPGRRRFGRSITWRQKSWVGASISDNDIFVETTPAGTYNTAVLFVPLVQVVDYATYPFEELAGPIIPQASRQERVRLTRCKLDVDFIANTALSPAEYFQFHVSWYLAKFSLTEVTNAIANVAGGGTFVYDPLSDDASFLFKQPVVRFGNELWQQQAPGQNLVGDNFSGFGLHTHHISFNAPMRMSLETDEEFYLVMTAAGFGSEEQIAVFEYTLQARTQYAT